MSNRKKRLDDVKRAIVDEQGRLRYANPGGPLPLDDGEAPDDVDQGSEVTWPTLTANQVVSFNLQRARKLRGLSQEQLGRDLERLTGRVWSKATVSAAEGAYRRQDRPRRFDANELLAFSSVLHQPLPYFFLPPDSDELAQAEFFADQLGEIPIPGFSRAELLTAATAADSPDYVRRLEAEGLIEDQADPNAGRSPEETTRALMELLKINGISISMNADNDTEEQS